MAELVTAESRTPEHRDLHGPFHPGLEGCQRCEADRHLCPGCGEWLYHGTNSCGPCRREHAPTDTKENH